MALKQTPHVYVFFSYARQDRTLRDKLEDHLSNLKYRGLITTWHAREVSAGMEWAQQLDIHLNTADIILLLLSSNYMASEYCYSIEMQNALERHQRRETRVIPILLKPVLFTDAPFAKLQFLPSNGKPVVNWRNRDSAFVDIALGIERVVQEHLTLSRITQQQGIPRTGGASSLGTPNLDPPTGLLSPQRQTRIRPGIFLILLGGLLTAIILLIQHPNFLPIAGVVPLTLMFLYGLITTIRALVKGVQKRQEHRTREKSLRRQEEERKQYEEERRQQEERAYYEKAKAAYGRALYLDFSDASAHRGMGKALEALGHVDEALAAYEHAVYLDPTPASYSSLGRVLVKLKRYNESLTAYTKAIELDPVFGLAYKEMAEALVQLGRTEEAQHVHEKAQQLGYEE